MKNSYASKIPNKTEKVKPGTFLARGSVELKARFDKVIAKLKKLDPKKKWTQNAAMIAAIEKFTEDNEKALK